jgi:hypothetical protein
MVLEVLLEERLTTLQAAFHSLFGSRHQVGGDSSGAEVAGAAGGATGATTGAVVRLAEPDLLIDLLTATLAGRNLATATMLSAICGLENTLDAVSSAMQACLAAAAAKAKAKGGNVAQEEEEAALADNPLFGSLLAFMAQQLDVLVVDPKLFRMGKCWELLAVGVNRVLSAAARDLTATTAKSSSSQGAGLVSKKKQVQVATAAAHVAFVFIDGARILGLAKQEADHLEALVEGPTSVFHSAEAIANSSMTTAKPALVKACTVLVRMIKPGTVLSGAAASAGAGGNDDGDKEVNGDKGQGTGLDGEEAGGVELKMVSRGGRSSTINGLNEAFGTGDASSSSSASSNSADAEAEANDEDGPLALRRYFWEALESNPLVNNVISLRRFALVECLENSGNRTGPELGPGAGGELGVLGADGRGSVKIEWLDIVARMVQFVKIHNFDKDQSGCLRVFRILKNYLLKSRCDEVSGVEKDPADLKEQRRIDYFAKQDELVECGVVDIALTAIATHSPGSLEGALAEGAIDLLMELLNGLLSPPPSYCKGNCKHHTIYYSH